MKHTTTACALTLATAALLVGCQGMPSEAEMDEQVEIVHTNMDELVAYFGAHPEVVRDYVGLCDNEIAPRRAEVVYDLTIPMDRATFQAIVAQLPAHYPATEWRLRTSNPERISFRKNDLHMSATFRPRRDEVDFYGTTGCRH